MNNKGMTVCFTGHRDIAESEKENLKQRLEEEIKNLIHQGVTEFRAGGALGFDTMAELTVLKIKKEFPSIRFVLVLPCWDQPDRWNIYDQKQYAMIRAKADEVIYTSWFYHSGCMQKRNRHLVEGSAFCVCYLTKSRGGTAYTVDYARQKGLRIINLA